MMSDDFMEFPMFAHLYLTYRYIDGLSMHSPYYSIPIQRVTDLLRLCFDFIYLWRYWYSDVLIIYSFGWLYYYYRFGLWSLRTISSIRSLRRHFDLSDVIFTYIYIALSFYNNNIVLRSPHLRETSYHFDSTATLFPFVPRPYISHIDLATLCLTSLLWYFIVLAHVATPHSTSLLRYFVVLARVSSISLWSRSIFRYIHRTSYTDLPTHLHSLSDHFRIGYWLIYLPYYTLLAI